MNVRIKSTQLKTDFCLRTKSCVFFGFFFFVGSVNLPLNHQLIKKEKAQIKTIFIFSSQLILEAWGGGTEKRGDGRRGQKKWRGKTVGNQKKTGGGGRRLGGGDREKKREGWWGETAEADRKREEGGGSGGRRKKRG